MWLALGTNLPPQAWHWQRLLRSLSRLPGFQLQAVSPPWPNPAQGANLRGRFLNGVAVGYAYVGPLELLRRLKQLEQQLGRRSSGDRPADFDILCWQDAMGWRKLASQRLQIPHRRAKYRPFVLAPLSQIDLPPPTPLAAAVQHWQRQNNVS